ncbi:hypothetical protein N9682_06125 [Candidatus Pelagibacter sp.]|nr:hypothetical protein [Candidatus Pelagibacter sp.]
MKDYRKSNIVVVTHSLTYSGAPLVALDLAEYLLRYFNVTLINMNPTTQAHLRRKIPTGVKTIDFPPSLQQNIPFFIKWMNRLVRGATWGKINLRKIWFFWMMAIYKPKYIIFNTYFNTDIQSISNLLGISSVRYLHENYDYLKELKKNDIIIINRGTKTIACSPSVITDAKKLGIKCEPEFLPAATDRQIRIINSIDRTWGRKTKTKNSVMTVGGGFERKGGQFAEKFATVNSDIKYHWIGEVELPELFKNVVYHGHQLEVSHDIANAFFLISTEEPWSISVLDALANGLVIFGWSHLSIIQELKKYGLAVSVPQYNLDLLALEYRKYDFSNYYQKYLITKNFLSVYSTTKLYENFYKS